MPSPRLPSLAQRALELKALAWPDAVVTVRAGRELQYRFSIVPGIFGRQYDCVLRIKPDSQAPEMLVLSPDLSALAQGRKLPHVYPHTGRGVKLCLWWPKLCEWVPQMALAGSYLAWTAEWLEYFEDWLTTGEWSGGGEHPSTRKRRLSKAARTRSGSAESEFQIEQAAQ